MDPLSLIGGATAALGIIVAVLNIREKLWPPVRPHPLEAALRDIAAAIRARVKA
jgi:hypothetical protein